MLERFTDEARKVLALANQEAQRLDHEYIGTEHILLGLVKEGTGIGATALKDRGIDLAKGRLEVEKLVPRSTPIAMGKLPMTPRAKKVIEYAIQEVRNLGHDSVGTEHLLLGLVRERDGVAAQVLLNLGVHLEDVRKDVLGRVGSLANRAKSDVPTPSSVDQRKASMYERFTDRARKVMALANQEAQRFNHEYIGTEHILQGLVKEGTGVGATVLKNLDVDLRKVRLEVEKLVKCGPDRVTIGKLPQTPQARKVIEYAIEESHNLGHQYVGTEHLLLGLLREKDGIAARVLTNLWLKLEQVREEVRKLLGASVESQGTTYEAIQAAACEALRAAAWPDLGAGVESQGASSADQEAARTQRIIKCATEEAGKRNLSVPHSEHLLLALLQEPEGVAARALAQLGLSPDQIRQEIDRLT